MRKRAGWPQRFFKNFCHVLLDPVMPIWCLLPKHLYRFVVVSIDYFSTRDASAALSMTFF